MASPSDKKPFLPPRWFIRSAWWVHRRLYRIGGARFLKRPGPGRTGMLCLRTTGRRSGVERAVIVTYLPDGDRMVTLAMNGWGEPHPAWWLNLRANPDAVVETADGRRDVRAREAQGQERSRLWQLLGSTGEGWGPLDDFARMRARETPVVVLEPVE